MSIRFLIASSYPAFIGRVVTECEKTLFVFGSDIVFVNGNAGDRIKIAETDILHICRIQTVDSLFHAVGEDAYNAENLSTRFAQHIDHLKHAAAG